MLSFLLSLLLMLLAFITFSNVIVRTDVKEPQRARSMIYKTSAGCFNQTPYTNSLNNPGIIKASTPSHSNQTFKSHASTAYTFKNSTHYYFQIETRWYQQNAQSLLQTQTSQT